MKGNWDLVGVVIGLLMVTAALAMLWFSGGAGW